MRRKETKQQVPALNCTLVENLLIHIRELFLYHYASSYASIDKKAIIHRVCSLFFYRPQTMALTSVRRIESPETNRFDSIPVDSIPGAGTKTPGFKRGVSRHATPPSCSLNIPKLYQVRSLFLENIHKKL